MAMELDLDRALALAQEWAKEAGEIHLSYFRVRKKPLLIKTVDEKISAAVGRFNTEENLDTVFFCK